MREFITIGIGAVLGANLRYWIGLQFAARWGQQFPYSTLVINITGSFILGFLLTLLANRVEVDPTLRLLIGTGFLGAYTTFSTFSYETIALLERGDLVPAAINAGVSLFGALLAAFLGVMLARLLG